MRLGVLSDTHDQLPRVRVGLAMLRDAGAEAFVHCGDITRSAVLDEFAGTPTVFVFGNHDADAVPELRRTAERIGAECLGWGGVVERAGRRVGVCHGHMRSDLHRVLAAGPEIVLSGHSHTAGDRVIDGVRRVNPGALDAADAYTVAIFDLRTDELSFLTVPG
jgi:putative phosphoesterase